MTFDKDDCSSEHLALNSEKSKDCQCDHCIKFRKREKNILDSCAKKLADQIDADLDKLNNIPDSKG